MTKMTVPSTGAREQKTHAPKQQAEEHDERAANYLGAQHGLKTELETDRLERRHEGKARAHHDGQARTDDAFYGELLKENVERREDERRLDDRGFLLRGKATDRRDDDGGRDDARKRRQHMLQCMGQYLHKRYFSRTLEQGVPCCRLCHLRLPYSRQRPYAAQRADIIGHMAQVAF